MITRTPATMPAIIGEAMGAEALKGWYPSGFNV
jgi:hypothetical protein